MLHIDLGEPVGCGLQCGTVLVGNDGGRTHDILKHRGPPCQLHFATNLRHTHLTSMQILDQFVQSDTGEFMFQAASFRQGIKSLTVIKQGLQTHLDSIEIGGSQIAARRSRGEHGVKRSHIADHRIQCGDDVVQLGGEHRPSAVWHELPPLLRLPSHYFERFMQVFHLGTHAQQTLGLLDMTTPLPEAHRASFSLALSLGLGRFNHRIDVALENLRLEYVEHAAQVLEHGDLALPFADG